MLQPYPVSDDKAIDSAANADIEWLKGIIVGIRNIRGEMNISPAVTLTVLFKNGDDQDRSRLNENRQFLEKLAKLEKIQWRSSRMKLEKSQRRGPKMKMEKLQR